MQPATATAVKPAQEKTMLGIDLRRLIISFVNGLGRGDRIRVRFRGTRAYTDGRNINLPAIRDLAEIPYSTARALMGYAIHEVAHIRYTDFGSIIRAIEEGRMEPDKLIKKFENAIEDYRIERIISKALPGTASDLAALRVLIHPPLNKLKPGWFADPRACGPLALTWTGSVLNGFPNPEMTDTLDAFPAPVRKLIDNWTARMKDVQTTDEVVDLAIAFSAEAEAYAQASRNTPPPASNDDQDNSDEQDEDDQQDDAISEDTSSDADQQDEQTSTDDADEEPESLDDSDDSQAGEDDADDVEGDDDADAEGEPSSDGDAGSDAEAGPDGESDSGTESEGDAGEPGETGQPSDNGDLGQSERPGDGDGQDENSTGSDASDAGDISADAPDQDGKDADGKISSDLDANSSDPAAGDNPGSDGTGEGDGEGLGDGDSDNGVDDLDFGDSPSGKSSPDGTGAPAPQQDDTGKVSMNDGMLDEHDDGEGSGDNGSDDADQNANSAGNAGGPQDADQDDADPQDSASGAGQSSGPAGNDSGADTGEEADDADASGEDSDGSNPLDGILDSNAAFDDFIDDLADEIANTPLPEEAPDAEDGEVNPDEVMENVKQANAAAPNYTSADPDPSSDAGDANGGGASKNEYSDDRFIPIDTAEVEECQYASLRAEAAGVISTTARTIRRLLMAEEQRGTLRGRRDGKFDIRNISAVVRGTGNCYKKDWHRPAPETALVILTDFSGSMVYSGTGEEEPRKLAMTGALAIEEATRGTQVETSIYGYKGYSPHVDLYPFKEGKQSSRITRQNIGAYRDLDMGCTPTGEAMAAVASILEQSAAHRRVLLVLTDGDADDRELAQGVVPLLNRRGIEVVAIGIQSDSVQTWCQNSHVIHDIGQLPQALLQTIDPRAQKKLKRAA
ncbi:VWA domain-containing protein [Erythrobacter aureus]|uniref:VWA domain-containing protein n=1 Tax=Erythrobacter aureus TaxID=2182384 RepID=A0A345YIH3_9SPHN|nr:VWA domain-containing protein [Erythrobacter aureus]AXK43725.1 VWA domain-containing protein [Erythrobacter aureus]